MGYKVAVVGATGNVGREMLEILAERRFPADEVVVLASRKSQGVEVSYGEKTLKVKALENYDFSDIDICLMSAGGAVSKEWSPKIAAQGAVVIDNSSTWRMDPDVPLIVPEVNADAVTGFRKKGIIANPNCSTIITIVAVNPIHRVAKVTRMIASTYQAASGAGAKAMEELEEQTKEIVSGKPPRPAAALPQRIAFNLFPQVDVFLDNGYTKEEMKLLNESRKIMHAPDMLVSATCVRVPVLRAHSIALNLTLEKELSVAQIRDIIAKAPGCRLVDDPANKKYPMPIDASGKDEVLVGRIRKDISQPNGIEMFVSGDQLLKGAALNAVQIAEYLIK